jgi:hypothetical protein
VPRGKKTGNNRGRDASPTTLGAASASAAASAAAAAWRGAAARHRTALLRLEVVRMRDDPTHSEARDGVPVCLRSKVALSVRKVSCGVTMAIAHGFWRGAEKKTNNEDE